MKPDDTATINATPIHTPVFVGVWISPAWKARLAERAKRHERSLSGELRWIIAREID
jgi:hypothetical protein